MGGPGSALPGMMSSGERGVAHQHVGQRHARGGQLGQAGSGLAPEHLGDARPPQVGVDEQHAQAFEGRDAGEAQGQGRLALARYGGGDQHDAGAVVPPARVDAHQHGAQRLGLAGARVVEHPVLRWGLAQRATRQLRHQAQRRQAHGGAHVVGRAQPAVGLLGGVDGE